MIATFKEIYVHKNEVVFKMLFNSVEECNNLSPFVVENN